MSQWLSHSCGTLLFTETSLGFFFVMKVLVLQYSPLVNVAHNISPVPVLNCELLNVPEPHREGFFIFIFYLKAKP